jgi:hypothetical protein
MWFRLVLGGCSATERGRAVIEDARRRLQAGQPAEVVIAALIATGTPRTQAEAIVSRVASSMAAEPELREAAGKAGSSTAVSGLVLLAVGIWNLSTGLGASARSGNELLVLMSPVFVLAGIGMVIVGLLRRARSAPDPSRRV